MPQNDGRVLPPSGIPIGNIQGGFSWLDKYQKELGGIELPARRRSGRAISDLRPLGRQFQPEHRICDRQSGAQSGVPCVAHGANAFEKSAVESGQRPYRFKPKCRQGGVVTATVEASGLDLRQARIVWEARDQEPVFGETFRFKPAGGGSQWIEVEAQLPDGRRAFAVTNFNPGSLRAPPRR